MIKTKIDTSKSLFSFDTVGVKLNLESKLNN